MTVGRLRVMVASGNDALARRLATQIRACGHLVVGPFDDMNDAIQIAGTVQAAILEVTAGTHLCFWVADALRHHDLPFVLLTDAAPATLPRRFRDRRIHPCHRHAAPLLDDLHRQCMALPPEDDDGIDRAEIQQSDADADPGLRLMDQMRGRSHLH